MHYSWDTTHWLVAEHEEETTQCMPGGASTADHHSRTRKDIPFLETACLVNLLKKSKTEYRVFQKFLYILQRSL